MKKPLALLLTLIFCLGALIACDTPEESSSSSSEEPLEIVYYDEIREFSLKDDAPEFKLCKNYNELIAMLKAPLENFDEDIFEDNYILMLNNAVYSGVSGYLGFTNLSFEENKLTIEWHLQAVDGRDYTAEEHHMNVLIVVPKTDVSGLPESVVVSTKIHMISNESEIVKAFHTNL